MNVFRCGVDAPCVRAAPLPFYSATYGHFWGSSLENFLSIGHRESVGGRDGWGQGSVLRKEGCSAALPQQQAVTIRILGVPCRVPGPPTLGCGQGVVKTWGESCRQAAARSHPQISDRPGCFAAQEGGAGRGRRDHLQILCAPYRNPPTGCPAAGVAGGTVDGRWPTWRLACSPAPAPRPPTPQNAAQGVSVCVAGGRSAVAQ